MEPVFGNERRCIVAHIIEPSDDYLEVVLSKTAFSLISRCKGACINCGKCCDESWRFNYTLDDFGGEKPIGITPEYVKERPEGMNTCEAYNQETKECIIHGCKRPVCKYWPILESDISEVGCPGFYVEEG